MQYVLNITAEVFLLDIVSIWRCEMGIFGQFSSLKCDTKNGPMQTYRIDFPGSLPDKIKDQIFDLLFPVAINAFQVIPTPEMREDVYDHIFNFSGLIVVVDHNKDSGVEFPVAFRMWDLIPYGKLDTVLYLAGMCVLREYQGIGIGGSLMRIAINIDDTQAIGDIHQFCARKVARYVVLRTQNPRIKQMFDTAAGVVSFPNGVIVPKDVTDVASFVAGQLGDSNLDTETLVSKGVYGHSLYGYTPHSMDGSYEHLFSQVMQSAGDAMVCVWDREKRGKNWR